MISRIRSRKAGILAGGLFGLAMLGAAVAQPASAASSAALPTCNGLVVTIQVVPGVPILPGDSPGADVIRGTLFPDIINAGAGNDVICGLGGNDFLSGASGADKIYGDGGRDTIHGNEGSDQLYGGDGNDTLLAGEGNDLIRGDAGDDRMHCGVGIDNANGGTQVVADTLSPNHGCEAAVGLP